MKQWVRQKFVTGKSDKVELERHLLGFYRIVWTHTNRFPQPPGEKLYLFTRKRAEKMFSNISGWLCKVYLWHDEPPQDAIDTNWKEEPEGENLRASITDFLKYKNLVAVSLHTRHHIVDIQSVKLPPRIKPVLTKWGAIYVEDKEGVGI